MLFQTLADATGWDLTLSVLTIMTPLVGIPLTAIIFYLRDLKEHQTSKYAKLSKRVEAVDGALDQSRQTWAAVERDFVGKEEWLRESMVARRKLEWLAEAVVRLDTELVASRRTARHAAASDDVGAVERRGTRPGERGTDGQR